MNEFTPEQEEKLKNLTEKEKDLLKDFNSSKIDTFIHITENNDLDSDQRCQVIYGLEDNLSEEQISVYAKPEFNATQMYEIWTGLCKLSQEQVNMYADPAYTNEQMSMIKQGFSSYNLSMEQVSMYAKREFSPSQMDAIISGFTRGLSIEQVNIFASPEFSSDQMFMIMDGFENEFSLEQVKVIANPKLDDGQMYEIIRGFNDNLSIEQVSTYAKPELNYDQMREIQDKFEEGLSINDINSYIKSEFRIDTQTEERLKNFTDEQKKALDAAADAYDITGTKIDKLMDLTENQPFDKYQINLIAQGIDKDFSTEQLNMYAKPEFNRSQMNVIYIGLKEGLSIEQVSMYAKPEFNSTQMSAIKSGIGIGLSPEQVSVYAKPEFNAEQMRAIEFGFDNNFSIEQVSLYAKPEIDSHRMEVIRNELQRGLSMEQINPYINPKFSDVQVEEIGIALNKNYSIEEINMLANPELSEDLIYEIKDGFEHGLSAEQVSMYAKSEFNEEQREEIRDGFDVGFSVEQVKVYANPEFNPDQMRLIEDGFRDKLSIEQVSIYAKPEFDANQMWQIENGLDEYKLSIEQVNVYAKPELDSLQMEELKDALRSGLSMEQVNMYAKPEFSTNQIYAAMNGLRNGISTDKINDIINSGMSPKEMSDAMFNEVKKGSIGTMVYMTTYNAIENYYPETDAFKFCRTESEAIDLIKERQLSDYKNQQDNNYSYSYKVIGKNGDLSKAIREDQKIILAPSYDIAKTINAEATVEAEYGDECIEGTIATLAHHGPRANNPAPCNTPDVPTLPPFATVVVSHIDLDTLGGIYALQGRKPEDDRFWEAAEKIDVEGAHHIHELDQDIQDKLNAYYAYNDGQPRQRYTEAIDVTKQIDDTYDVVRAIVDIDDPEHNKLIAAGKEWAQTREKEVEDQLVYENKDVRVFDTNGIFCAASYFSPNQNTICPATVTYNEKFKSITLAFEDSGKQLNAREIVQELWGPEAGGREGIAGSPRNVEMTKDDLAKLVNELTERQLKLETEIKPHQFEENQMLSSISIPDNIGKIGEGAFKNCLNLSEMLVTNELLAKTDIASAFEGTNLDIEGMEKIASDFIQTHEGQGMVLDANDKIEDEPLADIEDEDTADDFGDL